MTLNAHKVLEQYFHTIINQPLVKEQTMFERAKLFFTQSVEKINSLLTKPTAFEAPPQKPSKAFLEFEAEMTKAKEELYTELKEILKPNDYEDGYWAFEMYTPEWVDEYGETVKPIHTVLIEPHEGTWMEVLDRFLDAMEKHYGYNIKEQVYYSVNFPLNVVDDKGEPFPGYGRCLNDERLQQILLAFPELYESRSWSNNPSEEVMFK